MLLDLTDHHHQTNVPMWNGEVKLYRVKKFTVPVNSQNMVVFHTLIFPHMQYLIIKDIIKSDAKSPMIFMNYQDRSRMDLVLKCEKTAPTCTPQYICYSDKFTLKYTVSGISNIWMKLITDMNNEIVLKCTKIDQCDAMTKSQENISNLKMYFVLLRSFDTKTNVFNDIMNLLPKFKNMGINTLWLSPPQPQTPVRPPMFALNDHGYWPSDHGKIDVALGGGLNFQHLIQEAQQQGIEIAIDAVLNHFGYANEVELNGKKISTSDPNYFVVIPDIHSTYCRHRELNERIENTTDVTQILQYREELSQYPLFDLPTLRKDITEVRTYLLDSYKKFVDMGVTTFRIDAAKHIPAEFLTYFSDQLNEYSIKHLNRPIKLIWEVYIANSLALSTFIEGTLRSLKDPHNSFFYDFPMRHEFKRIQDPSYRFEWLASFVQHRIDTHQHLNRLIPLVEDHDDGTLIHNPSITRMIYILTEFSSQNSTFIYHGSEQAGIRVVNRPRINTVSEDADIAVLVSRLGSGLSPYRICKETHTYFHATEHDLLVSEKRLSGDRSMVLAVNKGSISRTIELSTKDLYGRNPITVEEILPSLNSKIEFNRSSEKIRLELSPLNFSIIEICF